MVPGLPIGMQYMMAGAGTNMPGFGGEAVVSMHSLHTQRGTSGARTPIPRDREGSVSGTIIDGPLKGPMNSNAATRNGGINALATRDGSVIQGMSNSSFLGSGGNGSSSSDKSGTGISSGGGRRKVVAKSRPWKAPVYAGMLLAPSLF